MNKNAAHDYWEQEVYAQGSQLNKYPYDNVVTFVFRNFPRTLSKNEVKILEIGSGAGNNLWFMAREGFQVDGLDASQSAVEYCQKRFENDGLSGTFAVGDFTALPYQDTDFHLVVDRAAITCCGLEDIKKAVSEVYRVLKKGGRFFSNFYSTEHSSYGTGVQAANGTWTDMTKGALVGMKHIYFLNSDDVKTIFPEKQWKIHQLTHKEAEEKLSGTVHAEWEIVVEKI